MSFLAMSALLLGNYGTASRVPRIPAANKEYHEHLRRERIRPAVSRHWRGCNFLPNAALFAGTKKGASLRRLFSKSRSWANPNQGLSVAASSLVWQAELIPRSQAS